MKEDELYKNITKLIDAKKDSMIDYANEKNCEHLDLVSKDILDLQNYIDGNIYYTESEIDDLLSNLRQYRVVLPIPINGFKLARARTIDNPKEYPIYDDVSVLSYTPLHLRDKVSLGRFNKKGQPIYYGSLFKDHTNLEVPFNEVITKGSSCYKKSGCYVNTLISEVVKDIKVVIIGLFSYIEKEDDTFIKLHPIYKMINDYYKESHKEPEEIKLLKAIEKVDDFFTELSTIEGNDRVYNLTSILGNRYFKDKEVDGILYPPSKTNERKHTPNFAIKPSSVDNKINHLEAKISLTNFIPINNIMKHKELNIGKIENCKIKWIK